MTIVFDSLLVKWYQIQWWNGVATPLEHITYSSTPTNRQVLAKELGSCSDA